MKAILLCTAAFLTLASSPLSAQEGWVIVSPGVKFGYTFGERSGWHTGFEVSVISWGGQREQIYYGALIAVEQFRGTTMFHLGAEGGAVAGASIGPSLLFRDGASDIAVTMTAYIGGILIPYVSATLPTRFESTYEAGTYLKIPITVRGESPLLTGWH
jgi:hypothetical protein